MPSFQAIDLAVLDDLVARLSACAKDRDKLRLLQALPVVQNFLREQPRVAELLSKCGGSEVMAALQVIAIGQGPIVFRLPPESGPSKFHRLLSHLAAVDRNYDSIGGIVGYHTTFLHLLKGEKSKSQTRYFHPPQVDIGKPNRQVQDWIRSGIEHLPQMAEIYPVGGAGDRLALCDEHTGEALPAAMLHFEGRTLLEGLIRDLEAREELFFRIHGRRLVTPVVLMTSAEKNNSDHIHCICESNHWFGRPRDSFFIATQCSVPVITEQGMWAMKAPLELRLKPGGHGALWKLMEDSGAFEWLDEKGRTKGLLRQVNNPICGVDYGLLAFAGVGFALDKAFGFAACHRVVGSAEGMNVLFERHSDERVEYGITSLEYTDFAKHGIEDIAADTSSPYSKFPSNTNILFFDLKIVRETARRHPLPGVIINLKHMTSFLDADGREGQARAGRLESSVQSLADHLVVSFDKPVADVHAMELPTYATFGERRKTISVTKRGYQSGGPLLETPEGCYLDLLRNARELLVDYCGFSCPDVPSDEQYLQKGPSFHCQIHPKMGPLYAIIAQKMRRGTLTEGSELQLDVTDLDLEEITVRGSMLVRAQGLGRVQMHRVTVDNQGIDWRGRNRFWQNQIFRHEVLEIVVEPGGEFVAADVTFKGATQIVVPSGMRVTATGQGLVQERIEGPSWSWIYDFGSDNTIQLHKRAIEKQNSPEKRRSTTAVETGEDQMPLLTI